MTFGPDTISKETYLAYTRADDSFRQLGGHVWCLPALAIIDMFRKSYNIVSLPGQGIQKSHHAC